MLRKLWLSVVVIVPLLAACAGQPAAPETEPSIPTPEDPDATGLSPGSEEPPLDSYAPAKGDEAMQRGEVFIDTQEILILESFPLQFQLQVTGSLPTPCHELRAVVEEPDDQNQIRVDMYSLVDPDTVCAQVLEPFDVSLSLGSYPSGTYSVFVNGEKIGEITA